MIAEFEAERARGKSTDEAYRDMAHEEFPAVRSITDPLAKANGNSVKKVMDRTGASKDVARLMVLGVPEHGDRTSKTARAFEREIDVMEKAAGVERDVAVRLLVGASVDYGVDSDLYGSGTVEVAGAFRELRSTLKGPSDIEIASLIASPEWTDRRSGYDDGNLMSSSDEPDEGIQGYVRTTRQTVTVLHEAGMSMSLAARAPLMVSGSELDPEVLGDAWSKIRDKTSLSPELSLKLAASAARRATNDNVRSVSDE